MSHIKRRLTGRKYRRWLATGFALTVSLALALPFIWPVASASRPEAKTFQAAVGGWTFMPGNGPGKKFAPP